MIEKYKSLKQLSVHKKCNKAKIPRLKYYKLNVIHEFDQTILIFKIEMHINAQR